MAEPAGTSPAANRAGTHRGWGRALILVYGVFAFSALGRSATQLVQKAGEAPLAYGLSAFAAVVYAVATFALARPGRRTTPLAWAAVLVELTGVVVIGILTVASPGLFPDDTVWSRFGSGYGFVPAVLPLLGLTWLWHSTRGPGTGQRKADSPVRA